MSSYASLSDHCNSIPSSRSVSHSEPSASLNILVDRIDRSEQIIWSTYDFIHNRKRNRLTEARARDLVCLRPFKPQTVAEATVVGLSGSKHRVGTLGSVRF